MKLPKERKEEQKQAGLFDLFAKAEEPSVIKYDLTPEDVIDICNYIFEKEED